MKFFVPLFIFSFVVVSGEPGIGQNPRGRIGPPPLINRPKLPDNTRFRRSPEPEPQGSIVFQGTKPMSGPERRPTMTLDYQHKIFQNKYGEITAGGGAMKIPGHRVEPHAGIGATFRFRRSPEPEPQGSIVFQGTKPMSGPERRPTMTLDYQHKIFQNKYGEITAGGGAMKIPGHRVEPHAGIGATFRFRRSPEPEPQGSIVFQGTKPMSGPERRPTMTLDYQHKIFQNKYGEITAGGGAMKIPGHRVEPHAGIGATFRFRRSPEPEPQGSIVFQGTKPMSGPERRPTMTLDYQHKIFQNKYGEITAGGGAMKIPGHRVEPHAGIGATFRFRRSPEEFQDLETYEVEPEAYIQTDEE
ncbi:uncharacterized protein [Chelonus insularis]|uniref:uncharacterized protein n=1 Tax=Chelonus insularis TaxID=460826 RepID=UPI00158DCAB4|nr:uncharacterized protein LOC118074517 [Chelonus insularis]